MFPDGLKPLSFEPRVQQHNHVAVVSGFADPSADDVAKERRIQKTERMFGPAGSKTAAGPGDACAVPRTNDSPSGVKIEWAEPVEDLLLRSDVVLAFADALLMGA